MSDGAGFRAVCGDCGWESESANYRDNRPYQRAQDARRALAAHVGNTGCDPSLSEVEEVHRETCAKCGQPVDGEWEDEYPEPLCHGCSHAQSAIDGGAL